MAGYSAVTTNIDNLSHFLNRSYYFPFVSVTKCILQDGNIRPNRDFHLLKVTASLTTYSRILLSAMASLTLPYERSLSRGKWWKKLTR